SQTHKRSRCLRASKPTARWQTTSIPFCDSFSWSTSSTPTIGSQDDLHTRGQRQPSVSWGMSWASEIDTGTTFSSTSKPERSYTSTLVLHLKREGFSRSLKLYLSGLREILWTAWGSAASKAFSVAAAISPWKLFVRTSTRL